MSAAAVDIEYDDALVERAAAGDHEAFADLYLRYSQGIYDFAARTIHDRDLAADVVQTTFTRAWEAVQKGTRPQNVKAWLYTIARNDAIDQLRRARRIVPDQPDDEGISFLDSRPDPGRGPEDLVSDEELANLVWRAASGLNPRQYSLLDLHLRQNLSPDELANSLGLRRDNVYMMLSRLRDSLEESVTLLLLMQRGRRECAELDLLIGGRSTLEMTREMRRLVGKHLDTCPRCQELTRRFVSPAEIFAGIATVRIPMEMSDALWQRILPKLDAGPPLAPGPIPLAPVPVSAPAPVEGPAAPLPVPPTPTGLEGSLWLAQPAILAKLGLMAGGAVASIALLATVVLQPLQHQAPFGPRDPEDVRSASHMIGQPSFLNVVRMIWTPVPDATGYAVRWSHLDRDLPEENVDLVGTAEGVSSLPLAEGIWYFHLRTRSENGDWTSTVHVGPFVVQMPRESPTPTATVRVVAQVAPEPSAAAPGDAEPSSADAAYEEDDPTEVGLLVAADTGSADGPAGAPTPAPTATVSATLEATTEPSSSMALDTPVSTSTPKPTATARPFSTRIAVPSSAPPASSPPGPSGASSPVSTAEAGTTPQPTSPPTDVRGTPTADIGGSAPREIDPAAPSRSGGPGTGSGSVNGGSAAAALPSSTPTHVPGVGAQGAPVGTDIPQASVTATLGRPPSRTPAVASPTNTAVPTVGPSATRTPPPANTACAAMALTSLSVRPQAERVIVTWAASGGCAPFSGSVTAAPSAGAAYQVAAISAPSGSVTDTPAHCAGLVTYRVALTDASGATVNGSAGVLIERDC